MIYAVSVIALSTIHDLGFLAGAVVVIFILAGRDAARVARRAGTAILIFTSIVSLSYAIVSSTRGQFSGSYLLRTNLRVFAMTSLTILLGLRLDVARACSFSPALGQLATLTAAQVRTFRRLGDDLRLALRSRSVAPLGFRDLQRHAAASGSLLLEQTIERSAEVTRAMRSRGAFDA
jgi:cobalt/nickel transport system permease protein